MKTFHWTAILLAALLALASPALAQTSGVTAAGEHASDSALDQALANAMTPGEGQKRLDPKIGTFDVKIRTWVEPSKPPVESQAVCINSWVLGNRYMQTMFSGYVLNEPFNGIAYTAYDNVGKRYQMNWMDSGSTAMTQYEGGFAPGTKNATLKATVADPLTGKPSPVELRLTITEDGGHTSELWGQGAGSAMFKMMELRYTRTSK